MVWARGAYTSKRNVCHAGALQEHPFHGTADVGPCGQTGQASVWHRGLPSECGVTDERGGPR